MRVGMLRKPKKAGLLPRTVAYVCNHYGIEFFYFNLIDVDTNTQHINAQILRNGEWVKEVVDYPDIVDNDPMLTKKNPDIIRSLKEKSIFTTNLIGPKKESFKLMHSSKKFDNVLIPYKLITCFNDIEESIMKYNKILLKPSVSNKGQDIYVIEKNYEKYKIYTDFSELTLTEKELESFYNTNLYNRLYISQPFIESRTKYGNPFDIRVHVRKNIEGKWQIVKIYPRIGFGKHITSTMTQGGGTIEINAFLEQQFGLESKNIKDKLLYLANSLPDKFQSLYFKPLDSLGIDLGITPKGDIWLFEINIYPAQKYFHAEDAEARVEYYRFLENHIL